MGEVIFCTTNDGSVGLYNEKVEDIYHSTYGAYNESYEKFLKASNFIDFIKNNNSVSVLDVCYGIGYNSKTALNEILKLDKVLEVKIDALEYDKNLINISPFLKNQKINNKINMHILKTSNLDESYSRLDIIKYFFKTRGLTHINWINLIKFRGKIKNKMVDLPLNLKNIPFLHNIYYHYISIRNKKGQKMSKFAKTSVIFHSDDARKSILKLDSKYNFIFLDAFTPKKLPTLWSLEFFKELYRLLDENGILVTYSSSAAIRSAMQEAGFLIGRSIDESEKVIGTVAAKKENLIKYKLSEYDSELLKTRAGIFYRDENLNALPEAMIARREKEVNDSDRITSSRFKKTWEKNTI